MPPAMSITFDQFLALRNSDRRLARLTHDVVLPVASGLELGPGRNPTALPEGFDVAYVDHAAAPADPPGAVPINFVWNTKANLADICGRAAYDFAIASQVAQYVPNLLGWFRGIFEVLRVGGVFNLSLPDRRFMFDVRRHTSTLGEVLEAFHAGYERASFRQSFDHTFGAAAVEPAQLWSEDVRVRDLPRFCGEHALALAYEQALNAFNGGTEACHCWVFTPLSFLDLLEGVSRLRLFPFVISQFASTDPDGYEFFVCLRRDAEEDPDHLLDKQLGAIAHVRAIAERRARVARRLGAES